MPAAIESAHDISAVSDRYAAPMFSAALHFVWGDRALAEDAVQAALFKAWRAAAHFDSTRALAPWLFAIVRRCAIDVRRREERHRLESVDAETRDVAASLADPLESAWEAWTVRVALDALPRDEQLVIRLAYFESLTQAEIAQRLGLALGTVKSRTHRAHARLRARLAPQLTAVG